MDKTEAREIEERGKKHTHTRQLKRRTKYGPHQHFVCVGWGLHIRCSRMIRVHS